HRLLKRLPDRGCSGVFGGVRGCSHGAPPELSQLFSGRPLTCTNAPGHPTEGRGCSGAFGAVRRILGCTNGPKTTISACGDCPEPEHQQEVPVRVDHSRSALVLVEAEAPSTAARAGDDRSKEK